MKYAPFSVLLTYEYREIETETKRGNKVTRRIHQPKIQVFQNANEALRRHAEAHLHGVGGGCLEIEPPIIDGFDVNDFMNTIGDDNVQS